MNEEAKQVLVSMVKDIMDSVKSGADAAMEFGKEQIPDVVNQLLMWHMSLSAIVTVGAILVYSVIGTFLYKCLTLTEEQRKEKDLSRDDVSFGIFVSIIAFVLFSFLMLFNLEQLTNWLKILVAPKLYIIEYGTDLIKSMDG